MSRERISNAFVQKWASTPKWYICVVMYIKNPTIYSLLYKNMMAFFGGTWYIFSDWIQASRCMLIR
jgi:hypothetical protein